MNYMRIEIHFEECRNEELINFVKTVKTVKTFEEVCDYIDERDYSIFDVADAFYTVYGEDFVCEREWNDYLWNEVEEWIDDAIDDMEDKLSN